MPRYLPVQVDAATEDVKRVYSRLEENVGVVPNFIKTLAHSGNFLESLAAFYSSLMGETSLSERLRQLVILKTCKLQRCQYTVIHHTELARQAGWSEEEIEALEDYSASDLLSYYEKEVLRLAEQVTLAPDEIQDDFWTQLDNHFTSDQIVELVTLIASFNLLNRFILTLKIEPDPLPKISEMQTVD